jgi:hypothetical protein
MANPDSSAAPAVLERLHNALNRHDLEALVACFDAMYRSEQPVHPDQNFTGTDQVRRNWSALFADIPDLRAELLRHTWDGEVVWAEWRWVGTHADGSTFDLRGVTLLGVRNDRFAWGRLYMEPVEV